jgi:zinc/manganese transport system permease protein
VCAFTLLLARPLLFASLDPSVARGRGLPVRLLGVAFLVLVGVDAAEATQAVGALLLLGLLAAPAGAAQRLTADPYVALGLSAALALAATWVGLTLAYLIPSLPPSFAVIALATLIYLAATLVGRDRSPSGQSREPARGSPAPESTR